MTRYRLALMAALCLGVSPGLAQDPLQQPKIERGNAFTTSKTLVGYKAVVPSLTVGFSSTFRVSTSKSAEEILNTSVQAKLLTAGIRLVPEGDEEVADDLFPWTILSYDVDILEGENGGPYSVSIRAEAWTTCPDTVSNQSIKGHLWSKSTLLYLGANKLQPRIREEVDHMTQSFIVEYLKANPKQ